MSWITKLFNRSQPVEPPQPAATQSKIEIIQSDIINYINKPQEKVMENPLRALAYTVAIKAICLFVALIFPFLGYITFGIFVAQIDFTIIKNFRAFSASAVEAISIDCIRDLARTLLGTDREAAMENGN